MNPTEHHLETLLRESTDDLAPDVATLVAGGVARGRRRQRRQGATAALVAVAAVGALGVAASVAPDLGGGEPTAEVADRSGSAPADAPRNPRSWQPPPPRDLAVTPAQVPDTFADLLPGRIERLPQKEALADHPNVDFLWNGFAVRVALTRDPLSAGSPQDPPLERCRSMLDGLNGECVRGPGGSALESVTWTGPAVDGGVTTVATSAFTPDGWFVLVMSHNAADSKDSPVLSQQPPITAADLQRVVTSDVWFE